MLVILCHVESCKLQINLEFLDSYCKLLSLSISCSSKPIGNFDNVLMLTMSHCLLVCVSVCVCFELELDSACKPTRLDNLLDLVLTTEPNMVENLKVIDKFSTSDHQMTECDVIAKTLVKDVVKVRYCYDCADYEKN